MQCQAVMALVGQAVFHGRIYKAVPSMDFRLEFIVSGADVTQVSVLKTVTLFIFHHSIYGNSALLSL